MLKDNKRNNKWPNKNKFNKQNNKRTIVQL